MIYRISSSELIAEIDSKGAELRSLRSASGKEYLWQGDPAIWTGRAPNLFPFVGRLTDGWYELDGKRYEMKIHGLAKSAEFVLLSQIDDSVVLGFESDSETMKQYPRAFLFTVTFSLSGYTLSVTYGVENRDEKEMIFGLGAHPGFFVPIESDREFTDYAVVFSEKCEARRVVFSDRIFVDHLEDYPLEDGRVLPLRHELFDLDAVVLTDVPHSLRIMSSSGSESIEVSYPGMDYVGFWHKPRTEAPYVCVEPWVTLPGEEGHPTVFEERKDLLHLDPGKRYCNTWTVTVNGI